jgi:hypothetical protein
MDNYIKVDGQPSLVRDRNSGAIININTTEFEKARLAKQVKKRQEQKLQDLENDVIEIKSLLRQLIEKS